MARVLIESCTCCAVSGSTEWPNAHRAVAADYVLEQRVGQGSYGIVRLARRLRDGAQVVIKEIPLQPLAPPHRKLAMQEAETLAMFNHANIIHCHEARCHAGALRTLTGWSLNKDKVRTANWQDRIFKMVNDMSSGLPLVRL